MNVVTFNPVPQYPAHPIASGVLSRVQAEVGATLKTQDQVGETVSGVSKPLGAPIPVSGGAGKSAYEIVSSLFRDFNGFSGSSSSRDVKDSHASQNGLSEFDIFERARFAAMMAALHRIDGAGSGNGVRVVIHTGGGADQITIVGDGQLRSFYTPGSGGASQAGAQSLETVVTQVVDGTDLHDINEPSDRLALDVLPGAEIALSAASAPEIEYSEDGRDAYLTFGDGTSVALQGYAAASFIGVFNSESDTSSRLLTPGPSVDRYV